MDIIEELRCFEHPNDAGEALVHHQADGNFPNGVPNPLLEENRAPTREAILMWRAATEIERLRDALLNAHAQCDTYKAQVCTLHADIARLMNALTHIASPQRSDGTWNRDREACRQLAVAALDGMD